MHIPRLALAAALALGLTGVLAASADALPGYDGCPANQARIAIRLSGDARTFPSCNLAACARANPEQRVTAWALSATFPPEWISGRYRSHFGAMSPTAPNCPPHVNAAPWIR